MYRLKLENKLDDEKTAEILSNLFILLKSITQINFSYSILTGAELFFPVIVGTLDSIHLSTALVLRKEIGVQDFLTHDTQLARAAMSAGLSVAGST